MSNKKHLWIVVPFLAYVFGVGIINSLSLDKTQSDAENRTLQQKPGIQDIIDKKFSSIYETYYTDQFLGRDRLLKLYTELEVKIKKSTVRNHYIVDNNWILPLNIGKKGKEEIQTYANKFNEFAKSIYNEDRDIFYISTPAKSIALKHLYPKYSEENYGLQNINEFIELLDENYIKPINIDEHFQNNYTDKELESFYFKTDHHWNAVGAYEGFKEIIKNTQYLTNIEYESILNDKNYVKESITNKPFIGSYNRNLFSILSKDEEIPYIYNKNMNKYEFYNYNGIEYVPMDEKLIIASERDAEEVTYGGAYTFDLPLYKIINKQAPIKKKLLIVRDSFQAPTSLMFSDLFETVEILDPRNTMELTPSKVINQDNPDVIMMMFHSETFESMVNMME